MNEELEDQIDKIFSDFKGKISKLVTKNSTKILKDQAKSLKDELKYTSSPVRRTTDTQVTTKQTKPRKVSKQQYDSDDDEDSD